MTPPFTCPTRHPCIPIGSLQNLQGWHPLSLAHHLQGCTPLQFLGRYPTPYLSSSIQKSLFPLDVSSVGPWQNIAKQQLGTAPRSSTNSNINHLGIPTPAVPISCQIMPHVPSFSLTKLCQSQQIADLGILDGKVYPMDSPACNTCSQTQVRMITQ
jgi:hypothetical protein